MAKPSFFSPLLHIRQKIDDCTSHCIALQQQVRRINAPDIHRFDDLLTEMNNQLINLQALADEAKDEERKWRQS